MHSFRRRILASVAVAASLGVSLVPTALVQPAAAAARPTTATADGVHYWNDVLLEAFRRQGGAPTPLARAAAMMHAGIFDVLNSAQWGRQNGSGSGYDPYTYVFTSGGGDLDDNLASGIAARDLLIAALPAQEAFIRSKYTQRHGTASQAAATSHARTVVDALKSMRANDGSASTQAYVFQNVPGAWRRTTNLCPAPATPQWGKVRPFVMSSGSQFRQPLPGGYQTYASLLSSTLYSDQLNEVKRLGGKGSLDRTPAQTAIGYFWANDLDATYKTPGQLLAATESVTKTSRTITDPIQLARLYAQVSLSLADAGIAAWDEKYLTPIDLWRPETAIRQADTDGNGGTTKDANWLPQSNNGRGVHFSPCFPAWTSGHATFGAAWAGVMRAQFGDAVTYTIGTDDPNLPRGTTRTYASFNAAAIEAARSRIFLGVHYQFDAVAGLATGDGVGRVASEALASRYCPQACG